MRYCRIANIIIIRNYSGNFYCIDSSNIKLGYLQMTTIAKRIHYTDAFKRDAVKALLKSKRPVIEMSLVLGIEQSILHRWKKKLAPTLNNPAEKKSCHPIDSDEIRALKAQITSIQAKLDHLCSVFRKSLGDRYNILED